MKENKKVLSDGSSNPNYETNKEKYERERDRLYWIIIYSRKGWKDYAGNNGIGGYADKYLKVRPYGIATVTYEDGEI